jgi:hypothetical protein
MAIKLRNSVFRFYGQKLPKTKRFQGPGVVKVSSFQVEQVKKLKESESESEIKKFK